jgi:hypothetical protein
VQLALDPEYPLLSHLRPGQRRVAIQRRPPRLPDGCRKPAAFLRHVDGSPARGLLRRLRPIALPSADDGPAHPPAARGRHRMVPTFTVDRSAGSATSFSPDSLATSTPQTFPVASQPTPLADRPSRSPTPRARVHCLLDPHPPGWSPELDLRGFHHWFTTRFALSASLAEPRPSGSTDPSRRCRGCSRPHPRLQDQAAPSFKRPAATDRPVGSLIPPDQTAPRGAPPSASTPRWPPSPDASPRAPPANHANPTGPAPSSRTPGLRSTWG